MTEFESTHVLRTDATRTGCPELSTGRHLTPNRATAAPLKMGSGSRSMLFEICQERRVDSVNRISGGSGRTSVGSGRIAYVSGGVPCLQGGNAVRVPPWAQHDPSSEGFALMCGH